jgi:class 3 adenylate cyclase
MVACTCPRDALKLALTVQTRLAEEFETDSSNRFGRRIQLAMSVFTIPHVNDKEMSKLGLEVRIGIYRGISDVIFDEVSAGYAYYGTAVNIASRVESAGHGGQILVSAEFHDAVKGDLGELVQANTKSEPRAWLAKVRVVVVMLLFLNEET